MNKNIIEVSNLCKTYGDIKAVDCVSFSVARGSFFAFLGQNGAGKSTTINILTGLLEAGSGEASFFFDGSTTVKNTIEFKNAIGVVFQNNVLDDKLTVEENLRLYSIFYHENADDAAGKVDEVVTLFGLADIVKRRFGTLSGGQKRKAEIARALLSSPKILFLDEPTTGLDPQARAEVWDILLGVRRSRGLTLFLTTHYMEETASADKVVIIHKGKIVCEGSPSQLRARYSYDRMYIVPNNENALIEKLSSRGIEYKRSADMLEIRAGKAAEAIETLYYLKDDINIFEVKNGSMDDVFLSVVGESLTAETSESPDSKNASSSVNKGTKNKKGGQ